MEFDSFAMQSYSPNWCFVLFALWKSTFPPLPPSPAVKRCLKFWESIACTTINDRNSATDRAKVETCLWMAFPSSQKKKIYRCVFFFDIRWRDFAPGCAKEGFRRHFSQRSHKKGVWIEGFCGNARFSDLTFGQLDIGGPSFGLWKPMECNIHKFRLDVCF